jgi:hypothetical protein
MRPLDFTISRLICTLAPPSAAPKSPFFAAPPVLVAKKRTKIDGSFLLLSSSSPEPDGPRKAWLGPAHQLTRYAIAESELKTDVSLDLINAMRRFSEPARPTNVAELGTRWKPYISLKSHLAEMLRACLLTPKGIRGLFEADVVACREVIKKWVFIFSRRSVCILLRYRLMFPHKAAFNASFAHGILFLEDADEQYAILC